MELPPLILSFLASLYIEGCCWIEQSEFRVPQAVFRDTGITDFDIMFSEAVICPSGWEAP